MFDAGRVWRFVEMKIWRFRKAKIRNASGNYGTRMECEIWRQGVWNIKMWELWVLYVRYEMVTVWCMIWENNELKKVVQLEHRTQLHTTLPTKIYNKKCGSNREKLHFQNEGQWKKTKIKENMLWMEMSQYHPQLKTRQRSTLYLISRWKIQNQ